MGVCSYYLCAHYDSSGGYLVLEKTMSRGYDENGEPFDDEYPNLPLPPTDILGKSIVSRWAKLQLERNIQTSKWLEGMVSYGAIRKPTKWERIKWRVADWRVSLARWIAGDNWPEE